MKHVLCALLVLATSACYADDAADYKEFGREVSKVISQMKKVANTTREKADLRALEFLLRDYNKYVGQKNWRQADAIRDRMQVPLARGGVVASNADKRVADRQRAEAERRHREEMRQRQNHHDTEMMNQQMILNQLRINQLRSRR